MKDFVTAGYSARELTTPACTHQSALTSTANLLTTARNNNCAEPRRCFCLVMGAFSDARNVSIWAVEGGGGRVYVA